MGLYTHGTACECRVTFEAENLAFSSRKGLRFLIRLIAQLSDHQSDFFVSNLRRQGIFQCSKSYQGCQVLARASGFNHRQPIAIHPLRAKFQLAFLDQSGDRIDDRRNLPPANLRDLRETFARSEELQRLESWSSLVLVQCYRS